MVEIPPIQGKIIDITVPISSSMRVFPGDPRPSIEKVCTLEKEGYSLSNLSLGSHTGTHIDASSHILENGLPADKLELENLMGKALLLDLTSFSGALTANILEKVFQNTDVSKNTSILLLKTLKAKKSSEKQKDIEDTTFQSGKSDIQEGEYMEVEPDSAYLEESAAKWIIGKRFKTIGVDSFSVDSLHSENLPVHHILFSSKVNIVECLDLSSVETGIYFFLCLPLKIEDCDGAPARALLISYP